MTKHRTIGIVCGALLVVGAGSILAWWLWQMPHGLGRIENEYPWQKATISVGGQDQVVEYCKFGSGVTVETKPYWKQPATTAVEAAAAQITCLRTGGTADDYLKLYAKPEETREAMTAAYGNLDVFVKANREVRQTILLGTVKYKDLSIVVVKAAVTDGPDPWVITGLCFTKHDGNYLAMQKPRTPIMKWLSQNDYMMLKQDGDGK